MKRYFPVILFVTLVALSACATTPTATPAPPAAATTTAAPPVPTATPVPPTATPVPPTATAVPPTATRVPPTATATRVPPTSTPTKAPTPTSTPLPKGWIQIKTAHAPSPRTAFAMTILRDGRIFMFGGQDNDGKKLNDTWVFGPVASTRRLSPSIHLSLALTAGLGGAFVLQAQNALQGGAEDWMQLNPANPPAPRSYHRLAETPDGKVWLYGGELQNGSSSSELFLLDPITKTLEYKLSPAVPPPARFSSAMFEANNQVYVYGGAAKKPDGRAYVINDFWRYDPNSVTWTELPKAPGYISGNAFPVVYQAATGPRAAFVDPHGYQVTQGMNYYYDLGTNTWGEKQSKGNVPGGARSYYSVVGVGAQAILTGGLLYDANTKQSTPSPGVWAVDLDTFEWTRLGDLPYPVAGHGGVFDNKHNRAILWGATWGDLLVPAFLLSQGLPYDRGATR